MTSIARVLSAAFLATLLLVPCTPSITTASSFDPQEDARLTRQTPRIHIAFLWHMHQPIYWPYESLLQTDANARYAYSVVDIHNQRTGPYTSWPKNAVQKGIAAGLGNFGAQVSFSGSLIENLDHLEAAGNGNFLGWKSHWNTAKTQTTVLGNPRLDMTAFGYHHPLMGLLDAEDIRRQVQEHKAIMAARFSGGYSKGIFPPENAFAPAMIPALVDEGIEWVMVDNIHFERACAGYPYSTGGNLYEPNGADVQNPNPGDWVSLTGLWAPTQVSAQWGHQPHYVEHVDPGTGASARIIAVPTERYMGNEDGRGGFGALNYDAVMSQLEAYNNDPDHPILLLLHHDGDNFGGGSESYYNGNFQAFVDWLVANPTRFECTTVQDYLDRFPPDLNDVIHAESGSWSGADNGDPEFRKWLGDPAPDGYSPDRNSWAVVTAAKNHVDTAEAVAPGAPGTIEARRFFMNAQASDYWYWDNAQDGIWDGHPTRAVNQGTPFAQTAIGGASDSVGPSIFLPQREPYNPGAAEWTVVQPSDFEVWTYAYDMSGLASVNLMLRGDLDGVDPATDNDNQTYSGGPGVGAWIVLPMSSSDLASRTNPLPLHRALRYGAMVTGQSDVRLDYYVEAIDTEGNLSRTPIQHVVVGDGTGGGPGVGGVSWSPLQPTPEETIGIVVAGAGQGAQLHWGVDGFQTPIASYWPVGTTLFGGGGGAVETPMTIQGDTLVAVLGPFTDPGQSVSRVDFVIHYADDSWENNGGQDYRIDVDGGGGGGAFVMDGLLDATAAEVAPGSAIPLHLGFNGQQLYVATDPAPGAGADVFVLISAAPGALVASPWGKSGQAAAWSAYLAQESSNGWSGWFDQSGAAGHAAGAMLEGSLDLLGEFGAIPPVVYVAVARYQTADGGGLVGQFPVGDGDGDVEAVEFHAYDLSTTGGPSVSSRSVRLLQNVPNPFNPTTVIPFVLERPGHVRLRLFDVRGRELATLLEGRREAGRHESWVNGSELASGVYFYRLDYRLDVDGSSLTRRMVLVK